MKADTPFLKEQQAECYERTEGLLKRWVSDFLTKHKIPRDQFERYMSAAHEGWCVGYREVDLSKGAFSTILYWKVLKYLYEERSRDYKQTRLLIPLSDGFDPTDRASLEEIGDALSPEARILMDLASGKSLDIKLAMARDGGKVTDKPTPARMRKLLVQVCEEAGWTMQQIIKAWKEVKEALFS